MSERLPTLGEMADMLIRALERGPAREADAAPPAPAGAPVPRSTGAGESTTTARPRRRTARKTSK